MIDKSFLFVCLLCWGWNPGPLLDRQVLYYSFCFLFSFLWWDKVSLFRLGSLILLPQPPKYLVMCYHTQLVAYLKSKSKFLAISAALGTCYYG
jgi:hypothetical protein